MNTLRGILRFYGKSGTHLGAKIRPFFAKMIAPYDTFEPAKHAALLESLEQDESNLHCVYCGAAGTTVDHLFSVTKNQMPTGFGHTYGNVIPCCHSCNSRKGTLHWEEFANSQATAKIQRMVARLQARQVTLGPEWEELMEIREQILKLLQQADKVGDRVHAQRE